MTRYTGTRDLAIVIAEGMKAPLRMIELPTDEGVKRFRITGTDGKIVSGKTDDHLLVTIDLDDPEDQITLT